jgi:hypothetical protein
MNYIGRGEYEVWGKPFEYVFKELVSLQKIRWSSADWTEVDEFCGRLQIDTRYLANVRMIIFVSWLTTQLLVALIDLAFQEGGVFMDIVNWITIGSPAALRFALQIADLATMAALLWSMNYIGRGEYEVWGKPFEYVFKELVSRHRLVGLQPEEARELAIRNDLLSTLADLDEAARERLRREIAKDQVYDLVIADDPLLEVDDVIELSNGDRFYITSIRKTLARGEMPLLNLSAWKIYDGSLAKILSALGD